MKIIQAFTAGETHDIILALTDTGRLFRLSSIHNQLPLTWSELPVIVNEDEHQFEGIDPRQPVETVQLPSGPPPLPTSGERKIDPKSLPPKLVSLLSNEGKLCPTCGMPLEGSVCIECSI